MGETAQVRFVVTLRAVVSVSDEHGQRSANADESLESHLDEVMEQLEALEVQDPSIELDLGAYRVALEVLVEAANPLEAVALASGQLRAAIHAAGGATPDWPGPKADAWAVRLVGLSVESVDEQAERISALVDA